MWRSCYSVFKLKTHQGLQRDTPLTAQTTRASWISPWLLQVYHCSLAESLITPEKVSQTIERSARYVRIPLSRGHLSQSGDRRAHREPPGRVSLCKHTGFFVCQHSSGMTHQSQGSSPSGPGVLQDQTSGPKKLPRAPATCPAQASAPHILTQADGTDPDLPANGEGLGARQGPGRFPG